jgi:hypothetical protein
VATSQRENRPSFCKINRGLEKCLGTCGCAMYRACGYVHLKLPHEYMWSGHIVRRIRPGVGA